MNIAALHRRIDRVNSALIIPLGPYFDMRGPLMRAVKRQLARPKLGAVLQQLPSTSSAFSAR